MRGRQLEAVDDRHRLAPVSLAFAPYDDCTTARQVRLSMLDGAVRRCCAGLGRSGATSTPRWRSRSANDDNAWGADGTIGTRRFFAMRSTLTTRTSQHKSRNAISGGRRSVGAGAVGWVK